MPRFRWLLLALVLLTGVWYYLTPRRAWDDFLEAIVTGQEARLQATIEFPILRDNLKGDLRAALEGRVQGEAPVLAGLSGVLIDPLVNATVTPQGLARLVTGFGTRTPHPDEADSLAAGSETSWHYRSPSRVDVRVRARGADPIDAGIFTFQRFGLSWRLVRIWSERLATLETAP
jgi:hypothetical protein